MANFYGQTRSNYFLVKDPEAFKSELSGYPVEIVTQEKDDVTLYGFLDKDDNGAGDVWSVYDEETEEFTEIDWEDVFARHLVDNWVAVIMQVGTEKYRYLHGSAVAYNNKRETKSINLDEIYKVSESLGSQITSVTY